jgi:predicted permease
VLHIGGYVPKSREEVGAAVNWIGPNFFETLRIPLVLGRAITEGDAESRPKIAVVNERFVRHFLGVGSPIGRRIILGGEGGQAVEIVGVVADTKYFDLRKDAPETIYLPWQQYHSGAMNFEVRTLQNPMDLAAAVRQVAQNMDRNLALYDVRSQVEQINKTLSQERLFARLTSLFGALAMLLACIGIYGVMAFAVTQRTREIGIRMALGASRGEVAEMVMRETLALVGIGMLVGIIVALGAARLVSSMLYGIKPDNLLTIAVAALLMVGAALFAAYFPTRRAMRVDPMVALRYE